MLVRRRSMEPCFDSSVTTGMSWAFMHVNERGNSPFPDAAIVLTVCPSSLFPVNQSLLILAHTTTTASKPVSLPPLFPFQYTFCATARVNLYKWKVTVSLACWRYTLKIKSELLRFPESLPGDFVLKWSAFALLQGYWVLDLSAIPASSSPDSNSTRHFYLVLSTLHILSPLILIAGKHCWYFYFIDGKLVSEKTMLFAKVYPGRRDKAWIWTLTCFLITGIMLWEVSMCGTPRSLSNCWPSVTGCSPAQASCSSGMYSAISSCSDSAEICLPGLCSAW